VRKAIVATKEIAMSTVTPVERSAPTDPSELASNEWPEREAHPERSFVQDDGTTEPARGGADDYGKRGGDRQRIAETQPARNPMI
jgi:hypothetical protein